MHIWAWCSSNTPCVNCGKGAYHFSLCEVDQKPKVGGIKIPTQKGQHQPKTGLLTTGMKKPTNQLYDPFANWAEIPPHLVETYQNYTSWNENQKQANKNYVSDSDFDIWD